MIIIKYYFTIHYWHHFGLDFIEVMCINVHSLFDQTICSLFRFFIKII